MISMKTNCQKNAVYAIITLLSILTVSCKTNYMGFEDPVYRKSLIQTYVKPEGLHAGPSYIEPGLDTVMLRTPIDVYLYGEQYEYGTSEFESYANQYGDTSFNNWICLTPPRGVVSTDPITKIEVIALDDYDDTHPKGSLLNDILKIGYSSYVKIDSISDNSTDHINQNKCLIDYTQRDPENYFCLVKDIDYRTMVLPVRQFYFYVSEGKEKDKWISVLFRFHTAKQVFESETPLKLVNRK